MRWRLLLLSLFALPTIVAAQQQQQQPAQAQPRPYETIRRSTGSYLAEREPLGLPLRVHIAMQSPYAMWCASPELFFTWAKTNCGDFMNDPEATMSCHGNPVPAAIGSYAPAGAFGKLAVGLVHFDDAAQMPFQLELLQGIITLRLLAKENGIGLTDAQIDQLLVTLTDAYGAACRSDRNATALMADDPWVARLLSSQSPYTDVLERYTSVGQFRRSIDGPDGRPRDILLTVPSETTDAIAAGLADAIPNSPALAQQSRYRTREDFRAAIRDVARRTELHQPLNSGTREYLVLLLRPLRDLDHDIVLSLRQQIPAAAERTTFVRRDAAPMVGQRVVRIAQAAMSPAPFLLIPAAIGPDSYTIELLDPWSTTLAGQDIKDAEALAHLARIWATAAGSTHHQGSQDQAISRRLTPELRAKIRSLSDGYVKQHAAEFERLQSDPSARADAASAKEALSSPSP